MDVHPTKNVSIGIDPYPSLLSGKAKSNSELALGGDTSPQLQIECSHPSIPSLVCQKKENSPRIDGNSTEEFDVLTHWNLGVPMGTLYFGKTYQMTSEQFFNLRICKIYMQ